MRALLFSLLFLVSGCAEVTIASIDGGAADVTLSDEGCVSYARPTGTCTQVGVCCVSSTCVDGICR